MKRFALAITVGLLAGCAGQPSHSATAADYFETKYNGQTYVFSNLETMKTFAKTKKLDSQEVAYFKSQPVYFEANGDEARLMAEYAKNNK